MLNNAVVASLLERLSKGRHDEVISETSRLIKQYPKVAGLHELLGTAYAHAGQPDKAERSLRRALKLMPGLKSALFNLGGLYLNGGNYSQAVAAFQQLSRQDSENATVLHQLGKALYGHNRPDEAIEPLQEAAALATELIEPRFLLGKIARDGGDDDGAMRHFESVLAIDPDHYEARFNIGNIHRDHRRNDAALACYERLLPNRPDHVPILLNIHACHAQDMNLEAAKTVNDHALELDSNNPEAHFNASSLAFLAGRWHEGYRLFEYRFQKDQPVPPQYHGREPHWDATGPVAGGRLVLHAEQGLGDSIMMLRFLTLIDAAAERPVVLIQNGLDRLAALSFPDLQFETISRHAKGWRQNGEHGAAHCSLMSLPHLLRDRWERLPETAGYLLPPADAKTSWASWLGEGADQPAIGLVWRGNPKNPNDRHRSVDLEPFARHLPVGPRYIVLQKDITDAERALLDQHDDLDVLYPELGDFADTAALCTQLDLAIVVDTSVAHLCGAVGTETNLLLPFMPDPRWRASGNECDWYDSVTVYRQTTTGDWSAPLTTLAGELTTRFSL